MFFSLLLFLFSSANSASIISGKIIPDLCRSDGLNQIIVSNSKSPNEYLYQVGVPDNGTFDFNLLKGNYKIVAISKNGCSSEKIVNVKNDNIHETIVIEMKK